jgi:membrane-bound lytic murein transglycosylase D
MRKNSRKTWESGRHALSSWTAHRITNAREKIETIAAKFHTTPQIIREVNNIPPKMVLKAGSTILVPRSADSGQKDITQEVADNAVLAMAPEASEGKRIKADREKTRHVAIAGDSLQGNR